MTSNEITTGSISASTEERRMLAARSRWWNSTGGGSHDSARVAQKGNIKAGDGGKKFRAEWPEEDAENWKWIHENNVDIATGARPVAPGTSSCGPQLGIAGNSGHQAQAVVDAVVQQREAGRGWMARNKLLMAAGAIFIYVLIARLFGEGI